MSASSPTPPSPRPEFVFRLPHNALRIAAMAFGVGLLLFVMVWWLGRDKGFYTPEPVTGQSATLPEALPEPMAGGLGASGMGDVPDQPAANQPRLVEETPAAPAPAPVPAPADAQATASTAPAPAAGLQLAPGPEPVPRPGHTPPPRYPSSALRRGETGTVVLRVYVGADGKPTEVEVEKRSGSRDLDRAAQQAVRNWEFLPAQRGGQAVASSVTLPIDFNLER